MKKYLFLGLFVSLSVLAASSMSGKLTPAQSVGGSLDGNAPVWVMRSDGSKSCLADDAQSIQGGADELSAAHIHVLDSKKGTDGKAHPMMCGAPTGAQNLYKIPASDLPAATALGFKKAD